MKRIISLAVILLLLASILLGCGAKVNNTEDANKVEPSNVEASSSEDTNEDAVEEASEGEVSYKDGTYTGEGEGMHTIKVSVEVADGKIVKVEIIEHEETEGIADSAIEQIPAAIVEKSSPNVEVVSGATMASEGIIDAVKNALESAKQ